MRFAIFPLHLSKVLRLPRRSDAKSYEVLHLSRKIILANLKIWCSKVQPLSGNQRPDLLTSLMNMSLVLRLPRKMHLCRSSSNVPHLPSFLEMLQNPHVLLTFDKVHNPLRLPRKTASERPKVVRTCGVFNVLTSKCALRHNGVQFLHISTSKSGPDLVFCAFWLRNVLRAKTACAVSTSQLPKVARTWCFFVHLDFEMCFAPQRRALFSTSHLPKVLRRWCALYILTWNCASHHNGVQFFISPLATWLRTRRFSEPTFRPSGATHHWKNTVFHDFPTFSRTWIFFLVRLSLSSSLLFSDSSRLCFSFVHIVGSLTSKLPLIMFIFFHHITSLQKNLNLPPLQTIRIKVLQWLNGYFPSYPK